MVIKLLKRYGLFRTTDGGSLVLVSHYEKLSDMSFVFRHMTDEMKKRYIILEYKQVGDVLSNISYDEESETYCDVTNYMY